MTDPTQQGQPSEEEIRAYLQQVREADAAAIVVQAYRMLGEGAEIKLGRSDARTLIDSMAAIVDAAAHALPEDLLQQMRQGVQQLQTAQVQAEREEGGAPSPSPGAQPPPATAPQGPAGPSAAGSPPPAGEPRTSEPEEKLTNRLWIPGREPGQ